MAGTFGSDYRSDTQVLYSRTLSFSAKGSEAARHWKNVCMEASVVSNLWCPEIEIDGMRYVCLETYFQVEKYDNDNTEFLMRLTIGVNAALFGKRRMSIVDKHLQHITSLNRLDPCYNSLKKSGEIRAEYHQGDRVNPERFQASAKSWDTIRMEIMYRILYVKFRQLHDLLAERDFSLITGDAVL